MPYPAAAIANYLLDRADAAGQTLTQINIQKLVYFAHGWHLGIQGAPLIEEPIEAWQYGPVVRRLYDAFKRFGSQRIETRAVDLQVNAKNQVFSLTPRLPATDTFTRSFVDAIFEKYGSLAPFRLVELTHVEGSPWEKARRTGANVILNSDIQTYFASLSPQKA